MPKPIGTHAAVRQRLHGCFSLLQWHHGSTYDYAHIERPAYVLELTLERNEEPLYAAGLRIVGDRSEAFAILERLCQEAGWALYDAHEGDFIHFTQN
ncbi:MAG: hypothetical protein AAFS10_07545 [Myxococcota bacterium]